MVISNRGYFVTPNRWRVNDRTTDIRWTQRRRVIDALTDPILVARGKWGRAPTRIPDPMGRMT